MIWLYLESRSREIFASAIYLLPVLAPLILLTIGAYARKTGRMGAAWWTSLMRWQLAAAFVYALPAGFSGDNPLILIFLGAIFLAWGTTVFVLLTAVAMLMRRDDEWKDGSKLLTRHAIAFVGLGLLTWCLALKFGTDGSRLFG